MSDKMKIEKSSGKNLSLNAHLNVSGNLIVSSAVLDSKTKKIKKKSSDDSDIKEVSLQDRIKMARDARSPGAVFAYGMAGAHKNVTAFNAKLRSVVYLESNHSPPNDCYVGTPYEDIAINDRPAHAMHFYHHRSPRGRLGGASSTGGSGVNKPWSAERLRDLMMNKEYGQAMYEDFVDLLNTTAPNRGYYALSLWKAALYAYKINLVNDIDLDKISNLIGSCLPGDQMNTAFLAYEAAKGSFKI